MIKAFTVTWNHVLQDVCIKRNWFTCGTESQYWKMFDMNAHPDDFCLKDIAVAIWLCSDGMGLDEIIDVLAELKFKYLKVMELEQK